MQLISKGTFRIDTSTNNNNILLLPGTGNIGIGTTGPGTKLEISSSGNLGTDPTAGNGQLLGLTNVTADVA